MSAISNGVKKQYSSRVWSFSSVSYRRFLHRVLFRLHRFRGSPIFSRLRDGLATFFNNLYKYLIGLAAALAVIMIIWGGLEYSTQDSISKKSDGKQRIYDAIFGLVLVLSPVLVFSIINPSILNLSLNLKPLDTKSVWMDGAGTAVDAATATAAGCTVTGTATQNGDLSDSTKLHKILRRIVTGG